MERDFHGKRCVRSRKATSPPSTEKVFARSKGKRFSKWRRWYKAARDQSGIRWAHNASIPTPFLLLAPSSLLKVSRLSRKWRKLFIVVASCIFHEDGGRERGERFDENACTNRSASLNRFGFSSTTINFTWTTPLVFISWWRAMRVTRFSERLRYILMSDGNKLWKDRILIK